MNKSFNMEVPGKRTDTDDDAENVVSSDKLCQPCNVDNVNTPSNGFCKECEEYMCTVCFRQHLRVTLCRHHTLLDINTSSETCLKRHSRATKCKQHDGETVKYYCRKHEAVGCGDCMISNHMACKPEFIKDLSDNYPENEEYKTLMMTLEKLMSARKTFEKEIQDNKKNNKLMLEKSLGDISQFRLDINKYLDKVEKDITCQVENVMKENESLLTKLENDCTALSTKLEETTNMLNSELYKDVILFIKTVECKPVVCESEKAFSNMKSKSMKKYEFICDQRLRSLISSGQKLGSLAISSSPVSPQISERAHEKSNSQVNVEDKAEGIRDRGDTKTEDVKTEDAAQKFGTLTLLSSAVFPQTTDRSSERSRIQQDAGNNAEGTHIRTEDVGRGNTKKKAGVISVVKVGDRVNHNTWKIRRRTMGQIQASRFRRRNYWNEIQEDVTYIDGYKLLEHILIKNGYREKDSDVEICMLKPKL